MDFDKWTLMNTPSRKKISFHKYVYENVKKRLIRIIQQINEIIK
jgi:hypothetical protein